MTFGQKPIIRARYFRTGSATIKREATWYDSIKEVFRIEGKDASVVPRAFLEEWKQSSVYFTSATTNYRWTNKEYDFSDNGFEVDRNCDDLVERLENDIENTKSNYDTVVSKKNTIIKTIDCLLESLDVLKLHYKDKGSVWSIVLLQRDLLEEQEQLAIIQKESIDLQSKLEKYQSARVRYRELGAQSSLKLSPMQSVECAEGKTRRRKATRNTTDGCEFLVRGCHGGNRVGADYVVRAYCREQILEHEKIFGQNHWTIVCKEIYPIQVINVDVCPAFQVLVQRANASALEAKKQALKAEALALSTRLSALESEKLAVEKRVAELSAEVVKTGQPISASGTQISSALMKV